MSTRTFSFALVLALGAPAPLLAQEGEPKTPDQKALYAIGTGMARDLLKLKVTPDELRFLLAGIQDQYAKKARVDLGQAEVSKNVQRFQRERTQAAMQEEEKAAKKFLADAAKEKGAKKLPSGLVYLELKAGEGKQPQANDRVRVTYKGTLRDGTVFDQVSDPAQAAEFQLGAVIPCWQQAIGQMRPGGKARFTCPAEMAYGDRGAAPLIDAYAALQFEVELLGVVEPAPDTLTVPGGEKSKPAK
jgi:FKBP-type peptidyl-prolyl cis-trans isomerase FkpA